VVVLLVQLQGLAVRIPKIWRPARDPMLSKAYRLVVIYSIDYLV
jgi:hypothetical protein